MRTRKTDVSVHSNDPGARDGGPDELRRAHERLSLALSTTGLGVWERDIATDKVTWSDTMHRLFGRSPEQFSGTPDEVLSFVHPDDRAELREGYQAAVSGDGDFFEQEFRIVRPDGEVRWVYRRGQVHRGPDGRAHSVLGVALDITERKAAEDANARLAAIASAADDAIMGLATDGTILAWNPAAERMFGYPAGEAIGHSARMLYPEAAESRVRGPLPARARRRARPLRERPCPQGRGRVDVAAADPGPGRAGRIVGVAAVLRDIGEHKRMEQKLVEALAQVLQINNQRKLALLAGRMGTFEVDLEREADHLVRRDLCPGRHRPFDAHRHREGHRPFIHPDDRDAALARRGEAYRTGEAYENEFRIVRPRRPGPLALRPRPALPAGNPTHVYGVSMDITERKEREAHIRFLMSEVSHRSKNLLAVVQAIASQTARSTSSPLEFADDFSARLKSLAASLDLLVSPGLARRVGDGAGAVAARPLRRARRQAGGDAGPGPAAHARWRRSTWAWRCTSFHQRREIRRPVGAVRQGSDRMAPGGPRDARRFNMSWVESGGAPVSPPKATGFGRIVIERMAAEALQGQVQLEFPPDGLRWHLDADAAAAIREAGRRGREGRAGKKARSKERRSRGD